MEEGESIQQWLLKYHKEQYLEMFNDGIHKWLVVACSPHAFINGFNLYLKNKMLTKMYRLSYLQEYYTGVLEIIARYPGFDTEPLRDIMNKIQKEFKLTG